MVLGIKVAVYHLALARRILEFHVYFHLLTKGKNIIGVSLKIMGRKRGAPRQQSMKANGEFVKRDVNLLLQYANVTIQINVGQTECHVVMVLNVIAEPTKNAMHRVCFLMVIGTRVVAHRYFPGVLVTHQ